MLKKLFFSLLILSSMGLSTAYGQVAMVDLELVLAVDASRSVTSTDYAYVMQGYIDAFDPTVNTDLINLIQQGNNKSIAVSLFIWSEGQKQLDVGGQTWWYINDADSAAVFSNALKTITRPDYSDSNFYADSYISSAINYAVPLFNNGYNGSNLVIDISSEGDDDTTPEALAAAVLNAKNNSISINAILTETTTDSYPDGFLFDYYTDNVITGDDAFAMSVSTYEDFGGALREKIAKEIPPSTPEPMSLVLFGAGLLGLAGLKKRK